MSDGPDLEEMGRQIGQAFTNAAEAMQRFAEAWNEGADPRVPLMSAVQAQAHRPT